MSIIDPNSVYNRHSHPQSQAAPERRPRFGDPGGSAVVRRRAGPAANLIRTSAPHTTAPPWSARGTPLELDVYTLRIYNPEAFEWDPAKRQANLRKHGIDFAGAVRIFEGPVLEREDRRRDYGEPRLVALGEVEEVLVAVVYTLREAAFRIISARRAHRHEQAAYRQAQSPEG